MQKKAPLPGLAFQNTDFTKTYGEGGRVDVDNINDANVILSRTIRDYDIHKVVLDIDLPAKLIPSSTLGHFHLYIDKEMSWEQYEKVLVALAEAEIIEPGYASASIARKYTAARLPWIQKHHSEVVDIPVSNPPVDEEVTADLKSLLDDFSEYH